MIDIRQANTEAVPRLSAAMRDMGVTVSAIRLTRDKRFTFALYVLSKDQHVESYVILSGRYPHNRGQWQTRPYGGRGRRKTGYSLPIEQLPGHVQLRLLEELDESHIYTKAHVPSNKEFFTHAT